MFKNMAISLFWFGCLVLLVGTWQPLLAQEVPQEDVPLAPRFVRSDEVYRLRVENGLYGSVALSMDGGRHYTLIGRVTHPATAVSADRSASEPGVVLRSSGEGIVLAVNLGQTLKLRPAPATSATLSLQAQNSSSHNIRSNSPATPNPAAIITNIPPHTGLFGFKDLPLPTGTQVRLETDRGKLQPFPTLYTPAPDDVYVFLVTEKEIKKEMQTSSPPGASDGGIDAMNAAVVAMGENYLQESVARARQEHRTPVDGILKLKLKLPKGEPDPIVYVSYSIDGHIVGSQNIVPFDFEWDTRQVTDGEHLLEIRACNLNLQVITWKRTLITVWNRR